MNFMIGHQWSVANTDDIEVRLTFLMRDEERRVNFGQLFPMEMRKEQKMKDACDASAK